MAVSPSRRVTVDEWLNFPQDHTELIDGEVLEMPQATKRRQLIAGRLWKLIYDHCERHGGGQAYLDVNVVVSEKHALRPDVIFVGEGEDDPDDPLCFRRPPALVIEVVSDPRRDLRIKKELYERFGVLEYWAVLPEAERIEVYRLDGGAYGKPTIVEPPEAISPLAVPNLKMDLDYLFKT